MAYLLKYYTFSAKIRTLSEFHSRIACNQQPPSAAEILTTLRYFQQTLVGFLKEMPAVAPDVFRRYCATLSRPTLYPNLNYNGLFYGIINLLDVFPQISASQLAIGDAILDTIKSLYFFLQRDAVEQLPFVLASQLGVLPSELDSKIVHLLSDCLIPFILTGEECLSVPAVLMMVLQHPSDLSLHTLLVEGLLAQKENVYKDMILVLAKGTSEARIAAANLLFHYWPLPNPNVLHRKPVQYRVQAWTCVPCQNTKCVDKEASVRRCFDVDAATEFGETAPPISLCKKCAEYVENEKKVNTVPICNPMATTDNVVCQNKGCESANRIVVGTCFSEDCIRSHQYIPLRLCQECFVALHASNTKVHIKHEGMNYAWGTLLERDIVEAIVKLLKETSGLEGTESEGKRPKWLRQLEGGHSLGRDIDKMADERRMLSRFGVWLMAAVCPPVPEARPQLIGYMMSMLFQWFATTALLPNDAMGAALEQLKTDFVSDWINMAITNHYEIFIETLLPNTPEYAQVGGIWDKLSTKKEQMRDGLNKLLAIMPYDFITLETWNRLIPHWMQSICELLGEDDLAEYKILLCKIFEPDLCPLPFTIEQLYQFITDRLVKGNQSEISQAMEWIYVLSVMEIAIPLPLLLDAFSKCAVHLQQINFRQNKENDLEEERPSVHVAMVDIISQQMGLNDLSLHEVSMISEQIFTTCAALLEKPFATCDHSCDNPELDEFLDCSACQQSAFVYQTVARFVERLCPKQQLRISVHADEPSINWEGQLTELGSAKSSIDKSSSPLATLVSEVTIPLTKQKAAPTKKTSDLQFQTASVHEESIEFVGLLPSEEVETAIAQATTLTETDVGRETCHVITSTMVENIKGSPPGTETQKTPIEFWDTSVGRFRFTLDDLPPQLRLINSILTNLENEREADVHFYMLSVIKFLCLHCESLLNARREHRGFLIWAQENLLIPKLWALLRADRSQLAELAIPLIMHCITLPSGEEIFWKTVNAQFTDEKWEQRFSAVERTSVLCQLANVSPVSSNKVIQTSLSCCFAHLIASVDDPNAVVAQRALILIQSMPAASLRLMCMCLESQFDSSILDRALIINRIQQLTSILPDEEILTWEFFIQRFEGLALESQLWANSGSSAFVHDLMHSDPLSDHYQRKLTRARQALDNSSSARSIVRCLQGSSMKHQLSVSMYREKTDDTKQTVVNAQTSTSGNYGVLREFTDEESNMCLLLNRVVDIENPERHIVHSTVSLFVSFLCKNKKSGDEKATAKKQSVLLRHFNTLIGYSNSEKCFTIPPKRLRKSAVCNSFLAGLPEILDSNLVIANQIVMLGVQLLLHLPSTQRLASDQPTSEYSLGALDLNARHFWLNTIILILYKYRYDSPPLSDYIRKLIVTIICTLEAQVHTCLTKGHIAKIELEPLSDVSSDDEEGETEGSTANSAVHPLHRPETLSVIPSQTITVVDVSDGKLESITEEGADGVHKQTGLSRRRMRHSEGVVIDRTRFRCGYCNEILESFDEETLSLCMIALETYIHREPAMAAPYLLRIINAVTRIIEKPMYSWHDTAMFVAGNCRSVAKQLIRVLLHQMSSSGIFLQLFDTNIEHASQYWSIITFALADFPELSPVLVIQYLLEDILEEWPSRLSRILYNLSCYVAYAPSDAYFLHWSTVTGLLDSFFRRYLSFLQSQTDSNPIRTDMKSAVGVVVAVLRVQNFSTFKSSVPFVESFAKWLTEALHECKSNLLDLLSVCTACNRALIRERDKQFLSKAIVSELVQAIKFKCDMHEQNYMIIVEMVLQDAGEEVSQEVADDQYNTAACDAVRPHIFDIIEFISDLHVLAKLKKITNSDGIGGDLKSALSQVVAVEMSRSGLRDSRTVVYIRFTL